MQLTVDNKNMLSTILFDFSLWHQCSLCLSIFKLFSCKFLSKTGWFSDTLLLYAWLERYWPITVLTKNVATLTGVISPVIRRSTTVEKGHSVRLQSAEVPRVRPSAHTYGNSLRINMSSNRY